MEYDLCEVCDCRLGISGDNLKKYQCDVCLMLTCISCSCDCMSQKLDKNEQE